MYHQSIETYHEFLTSEYEDLKRAGVEKLTTEGIIPPGIRVLEDKRRSLDLYYSFSPAVRHAIGEKVLDPAKKIFEELETPQIVFGPDWLHVSLLVIMGAEIEPPFDPATENIQAYGQIAREVLSSHRSFDFTFSRLIAFPGGIMLGGFPQALEINPIRQSLRERIDNQGLRRFERRPLQIFHATLVRWDTALDPARSERVLKFVEQLDHTEIATGRIDTVIFADGGYNGSPENTRVIDDIRLH